MKIFRSCLALLSAASLCSASWETPVGTSATAPVTARRMATVAPPPVRGAATEKLYGASEDTYSPRYGYIPTELTSQTLDSEVYPLSFATVTYSSEAQFGPFGEASTLEFEGAWRLFAFEEFLAGYLDIGLNARLLGYVSDPGVSALPDLAAHLALDVATSWRYINGWSLELRAAPGIYSDITEPQFNCPVTVNFHYSLSPTLGGVGGLTVRPGWDLPVMPNVGLAWQPVSFFRLEAMLPCSRVLLTPFRPLTLFGSVEWRNFDYALADEPGYPDAFTVDEWLATAGLLVRVNDDNQISVEFGTYLSRELSADVASNQTIPISEEWLMRLGWHGAF